MVKSVVVIAEEEQDVFQSHQLDPGWAEGESLFNPAASLHTSHRGKPRDSS